MNYEIFSEFFNIDLGDKRLDKRAQRIAQRLVERPNDSFPNIFPNQAELEAFYRFVENPYVKNDHLFEGHRSATIARCANHEEVLVVHDTTEFSFSGIRENLDNRNAFLGHCSLALGGGENIPLGVLRMETWVRDKENPSPTALRKAKILSHEQARKLPSEMDRWGRGVDESAALFSDSHNPIHICDSEGDDYALLIKMAGKHRFVVRGCYNRKIAGTPELLVEVLKQAPLICERTVHVSKRIQKASDIKAKRNQARNERIAKLSIQCAPVTIIRPKKAISSLPKNLSLNVVYVKEIAPPEGVVPIEWILLSSENIATKEDVLRIIDIYKARWIIEEYFKALKTGCSFEKRQLESYSTLLVCMTLLMPVAWLMLGMRAKSRRPEAVPANKILPQVFVDVLEAQTNTHINTAQTALLAIARLGGHIKANGSPGWLVMWRGFRELATLVQGFMLAQSVLSRLSTKRCDQS